MATNVGEPTKVPQSTRHAYVVGASEFGGPKDPKTGHIGYHSNDLRGKPAFAELYMGSALGNLPFGTKLKITYRQSTETSAHTVVGEKLDIGAGGTPVQGHARRIDLWYELAAQLHFSGTGLVAIERLDGKPIIGPSDTNVSKYGLGATTVGAGILGTGIGPNTETEGSEASEKFKEAAEGAVSWAKELGKILSFIGSSEGWVRIGKVVLGAGLLVIALSELTKISPEVPSVGGGVAGAAKKVGK